MEKEFINEALIALEETQETKKPAGGLRHNSGRKRVSALDRKIAVTVYISNREIQKLGGLHNTKLKVINFISENESREEVVLDEKEG